MYELHIGLTVAMYNAYVKNGSVRKVRRRARQKLQGITVPNRKPFLQSYNKLRQRDLLLNFAYSGPSRW
jgi:hypothetical protein